ncbi:MAG: hypothetical protein ACKVG6_13740 [Alphaproteobacteria bacterium]
MAASVCFGAAKVYVIPLLAPGLGFHAGNLSIRVDTYVIAETFCTILG